MRDEEIQLVMDLNCRRWRWAGRPRTPIYLWLSLVCVHPMDLWLGLSPSTGAGWGWELLLPGEKLPARSVKNYSVGLRTAQQLFSVFSVIAEERLFPLLFNSCRRVGFSSGLWMCSLWGSGIAFWVYLDYCTSPESLLCLVASSSASTVCWEVPFYLFANVIALSL